MTIKTFEQIQTSSQFPHISEEQLALQHRTRPDSDITADVRRVLQEDTLSRATADQIDARVNAGVVYLGGYVPTHSHKVRAETDVRQVQGIRQVENNLIADPDLEAMVTQQLTRDARLCGYTIFVHTCGSQKPHTPATCPELNSGCNLLIAFDSSSREYSICSTGSANLSFASSLS